MPEVQSVGSQYQMPQYPVNDVQTPVTAPEEYEAYPVYNAAQEKQSSSHMLAYSLVGLAAATIGVIAGKKWGSGSKQALETELVALKNSEAVRNYDALKKSHEGLKNAAEDMMKEANDETWHLLKPWTWCKKENHKYSIKEMKEKLKDFINVDAKSEKALEKEAKKAGDKAKDSAKDAAKDTAKKD